MNRATTALAATLILLLSSGCGSLFGQKQLEQCRGESERLLVEYRAERDARQRTEIENRALFDRVAELEKRLAAIDGTAGSRLAARGDAVAGEGEETFSKPAGDAASPAEDSALRQSAAPPNFRAPAGPAVETRQAAPDPWRAVPQAR